MRTELALRRVIGKSTAKRFSIGPPAAVPSAPRSISQTPWSLPDGFHVFDTGPESARIETFRKKGVDGWLTFNCLHSGETVPRENCAKAVCTRHSRLPSGNDLFYHFTEGQAPVIERKDFGIRKLIRDLQTNYGVVHVTQFYLSSNTQALINTAVTNGPGTNNVNYVNADNAICADITPNSPLNKGEVLLFAIESNALAADGGKLANIVVTISALLPPHRDPLHLIHQNFPGQYLHLARHLGPQSGQQVVFFAQR